MLEDFTSFNVLIFHYKGLHRASTVGKVVLLFYILNVAGTKHKFSGNRILL